MTLHLSLEDNRFWPITGISAPLFTHPTLQSLKLSCATIDDQIGVFLEHKPRTPLKHLAFIECGITQTALRGILARPTGLEVLSLGEDSHGRSFQYSSVANPVHKPLILGAKVFLASLEQQDKSLRSFAYATTAHPMGMSPILLQAFDIADFTGLSTFCKLRSLSVEGCSEVFGGLLSDARTAPPGLHHLHFAETRLSNFMPLREAGAAGGQVEQQPWWIPMCATNSDLRTVEFVTKRHQRLEERHGVESFAKAR